MPISRLHSQYWDCTRRLRNLKIEWAQFSNITDHRKQHISNIIYEQTNRVRALASKLELRALWVGETLNGSTPQVWGLSVPVPRPKGREILWIGKFSRSPWRRGLPMLMVTTELQELFTYILYLCTQWQLKQQPGFNCAWNRTCTIAHQCHTVSRLRKPSAQIPRLHTRTYTYTHTHARTHARTLFTHQLKPWQYAIIMVEMEAGKLPQLLSHREWLLAHRTVSTCTCILYQENSRVVVD